MNHQVAVFNIFLVNGLIIWYVLYSGAQLINILSFIALEIVLIHFSFSVASIIIAARLKDPALKNQYIQSIFFYPLSLIFYFIPAWLFLHSVWFLHSLENIGANNQMDYNWLEALNIVMNFLINNYLFTAVFSLYTVIIFLIKLLQVPYTWKSLTHIKRCIFVLISPIPVTMVTVVCVIIFSPTLSQMTSIPISQFSTQLPNIITILVLMYKAYLLDFLQLIEKTSPANTSVLYTN